MTPHEVVQGQLADLAQRLESSCVDCTTELECFDSGAAMLDVRRGDRLVVVAYFATGKFGVDEVEEDEGLDSSFRFIASTLAEAEREARRLLHLDEVVL